MNNPELKQQVDNRRTFAIISPSGCRENNDYEQLLLFGGGFANKEQSKEKDW